MKLATYLKAEKITFAAFGAKIGVHVSQISRWASGERVPSLDQAAAIKEASGGAVAFEDFLADSDAPGRAAAADAEAVA